MRDAINDSEGRVLIKQLVLAVSVATAFVRFPAAISSHEQQRPLTPNMRVHNFRSEILSKERHVLVWLPSGYEAQPSQRYAVFYMHDGQNKYINWRIDERAERLIRSGEIEPLILVGVYHGGSHDDRYFDYTPTYDPNYRRSGNAAQYGRMIVEELKPFIDSTYRTLPEPENTGLGGASLGGLVSLYLGLKYPTIFGKLALISPSVWWDSKLMIRTLKKLDYKPPLRIWLDIGTREGTGALSVTRELRDAFVKNGWVLDKDLMYLEAKNARHDDKAFAERADEVLKFLFPLRESAR